MEDYDGDEGNDGNDGNEDAKKKLNTIFGIGVFIYLFFIYPAVQVMILNGGF